MKLTESPSCHRAQRARPQSKQAAKPQQPLLLVLYASQTGTGEEIARSLGTDASQHGFKSKVTVCHCSGVPDPVRLPTTQPPCILHSSCDQPAGYLASVSRGSGGLRCTCMSWRVGQVLSCDELGFEALKQQRPEAVIMVASSTGDGDAPDNATKFFAAMRKAGQPTGALELPYMPWASWLQHQLPAP